MNDFIKSVIKREAATSSYKYALLGRMKMDCEYYLGASNRCKKHLWSLNEAEHIENMKALYNSFPDGEKPEWLSIEDIERFEKEMVV